jgi:hypothetical protein
VNDSDLKELHYITPIANVPSIMKLGILSNRETELRLSVVEELEAVVNANLQRAISLRQSILQRAFEGKLLPAEVDQTNTGSEELSFAAESSANYGPSR